MQSRSLPERPNLDHLKHEAKARLKALRESDPDAKLTDAQRILAREYGFTTWARLRAHVLAAPPHDAEAGRYFLAAIQSQDLAQAKELLARYPSVPRVSLHAAAALGDAENVARIARERPDAVHEKAGDAPAEPLLYLCFSPFHGDSPRRDAGLLESTRHLLAAGADPNTKDSRYGVAALYGVTGMHNAPPIARLLLEAGANPTDGESVFHAAESFHVEALELLWQFGVRLNYVGEWGNTALYFVLLGHDLERDEKARRGVTWLLEHGADPNVPSGKESEDALHVAARRGQPAEVVRSLLAHGANVKARRRDGATAWRLAKRGGFDGLAAIIEGAGATPEPLSPADDLLAACARGDIATARRLGSPALIASLTTLDRALLNEAARAGRPATVEACIAAGFDVNAENERRALPIHEAAIGGHARVVAALINAGSRLDVRDPEHHGTPLRWAIFGKNNVADPDGDYDETIRLLQEARAPE